MRSQRHSAQEHEGQVLILLAIASLILFGFAALAVDAGLALSERRGAQNAADAASLAVARAMVDRGQDAAEDEATIAAYLESNGYPDMEFDWEYTTDPDGVRVDVQQEVPRVFLRAFYEGDWSVGAGATASLDTVPADYGLIALDESGNAIDATGNTHVRVNDGGIMSNADISCAGSSTITAGTAVHAAGDILDTSQASIACVIDGEDGGETSGRAALEDPLAGTPTPPNPFPAPSLSAGSCEAEDEVYNSVVVCQPGRYTSWPGAASSGWGLRLMPGTYYFDGANVTTNPYHTGEIEVVPGEQYNFYVRNATFSVNNATMDMGESSVNMYFLNSRMEISGGSDLLTLGAGLYYFDNSDFQIGSGGSAVGDNVSFFYRNGGAFISDGNSQQVEFTAPSTPLYGEPPGMLFHAEPGSDTRLDFGAYSRAYLEGLVYAPDSDFLMSGNVDGTWAHGQLIVGRFSAEGSLGTAANPSLIEYEQYVDMGTPGVWLTQ